jgi:putative DNA primase/helicase
MIGKLPDTLADRSVAIQLRRRLSSEQVTSFRHDRVAFLKVITSKASRWAADHAAAIAAADPELPPSIFNRDADNWFPLFSIAAVAGGEWPERVKKAALAQSGTAKDDGLRQSFSPIFATLSASRTGSLVTT